MAFDLTDIGPCKKRAEVTLSTEDVQKGFNEVYEEICETISFPGFRKGKVPRSLVAKKHGKDIIGEVKQKLINTSFFGLVDDEKLDLISTPQFDEKGEELKEGATFSFSVSFEIKPEFELPEYNKISLTKKIRTVKDSHLEDTRKNLLQSHARPEMVKEGDLLEGDIAMLNLEVHEKGKDEVIHHNNLFGCLPQYNRVDIFTVEDLKTKMAGMTVGEVRTVDLNVPEEFPANPELAGKKVELKLELDSINRPKVPELNDDFAKNLGFDSLEAFNETLTKMLEEQFENRARGELKDQIYDYLEEKIQCELPEETVANHKDYLINMQVYNLMRSGIPQEEAEAKREDFSEECDTAARREIKVGFALSRISTEEKTFVTEREVNQRIVQLAQQRSMNPEKLKEEMEKNHELAALRNQLKEEKVIDLIIKKAEIEEKQVEDDQEETA